MSYKILQQFWYDPIPQAQAMANPPHVTDSICKGVVLEGFLRSVTKDIPKEIAIPPSWKAISGILKAAIRDDTTKLMLMRPHLKLPDHQLDHVFEVQYFAATFLHTVAEYIHISGDHTFQPDVTDILFAVHLINSTGNLRPLSKNAHTFKTTFFRASQIKKFSGNENKIGANLEALLVYLQENGPLFSAFLMEEQKTLYEKPYTHADFKNLFITNLLKTPWCLIGEWKDILLDVVRHKTPFSTTITMKNYVPHPWLDDNVIYDKIAKAIVAQPTEDKYIELGTDIQCYDNNQVDVYINIELDSFTQDQLAKMGLLENEGWLE